MFDSSRRVSSFISRFDVVVLLLAAALLAGAGLTLAAVPTPSLEVELSWQKHWKNYARRSVKMRDAYYTCSAYENQYPSSLGMTTINLRQKSTREVTEHTGSVKVKRNLIKPNEEIDAGARTLPALAYGHYGSIHSAQVVEVLGPDEMIIAGIWLLDPVEVTTARTKEKERLTRLGLERDDVTIVVDWLFAYRDDLLMKQRDRAFREPLKLRGFSTIGLSKGDRWTGKDGSPQIAIVATEEGPTRGSAKSKSTRKAADILVAIPADAFKVSISDEKVFLALLEARGHTKESFVAIVEEEKKLNPTDARLADAMIFARLDGRTETKEEEKPATKPPRERTKPSF